MKTEKKYNLIYIILNEVNGKTYIGAHSTNDLDDGYMGSGTALKRAQEKYGIEKFKKTILYDFDSLKEMYEKEEEIVNEDFIKSKFNYNIKLGGIRGADTTGMVVVKDSEGNIFQVAGNDPRYLSGELVGHTKGFVIVKDSNSNIFQVSVNDPRYLSGELKHVNEDYVITKNSNGETFYVTKDDPRYLSGELKHVWKGRKMTEEHKTKIGKANSIKQKGKANSQYGTCWIHNLDLKVSKKIKKEELDSFIQDGWIKGRKLKY